MYEPNRIGPTQGGVTNPAAELLTEEAFAQPCISEHMYSTLFSLWELLMRAVMQAQREPEMER